MNRILTVAITASFLSAPVMAAPSSVQFGQRTRTEPALACMLGFATWGCWNEFFSRPYPSWHLVRYCAKKYVHERMDNCPDGYLEAVDYLGTNLDGYDVYKVKFKHADLAYVIPPPAEDGKIDWVRVKRGSPSQIVPSSLIDVPGDRAHKLAMYRRPWR